MKPLLTTVFIYLFLLLAGSITPLWARQSAITEKQRKEEIVKLEKKYSEAKLANNNFQAGNTANSIAHLHWALNDRKTAVEYFKKAIIEFEQLGDKRKLAENYENIGYVEASQRNFLVAVNNFNVALKLFQITEDKPAQAQMNINIGSAMVDASQYKRAVQPLLDAKELAEEVQNDEMLIDCYNLLSLAYERLNDRESALFYYKQLAFMINRDKRKYFEQVVEQIEQIEKVTQEKERANQQLIIKDTIIQSLALAKELAEKEKALSEKENRLNQLQLDSLNKQNQLDEMLIKQQQSELESEKIVRNLTLLSLTIFMVLLIFLYRANHIRKKSNQQLAFQNAEINKQKDEIEGQKNQLEEQNVDLHHKQRLILEQQAEIQKIVVTLEKANQEITQQKEEVTAQKDEVERSYQTIRTLSVIGQSITATLDQDSMLDIIHTNLIKYMDVSVFGIGLKPSDQEVLVFSGKEKKGKKLPPFELPLNDDLNPAAKSFEKQREVMISNLKSSRKYPDDYKFFPTAEVQPLSAIFQPLSFDQKAIGVMTVQSTEPNAYNRFHIGLLNTLASYISIALENASSYQQLEAAKQTIEENNRQTLDSIRYAEQIQKAVLPELKEVENYFTDAFTLYKPKDIVSGDFYWFRDLGEKAIVIVADCTGHGVPGAFMSMIGATLIDEAVSRKGVTEPAAILENLHDSIRKALQQETGANEDGMDVCICAVEKKNGKQRKVNFAGAKRPLFTVKDGKLEKIQADRKSIGGRQKEEERSFTNETLVLAEGTMIYLTSDGYADQHNDANEKYGVKKFKQLLIDISNKTGEEQREWLDQEITSYQQTRHQRDDITIAGFRV